MRHQRHVWIQETDTCVGGHVTYTISFKHAKHVLDLLICHPGQLQPLPDEGPDVPDQVDHVRLLLSDVPVGLKLAHCLLVQLGLVTFHQQHPQ